MVWLILFLFASSDLFQESVSRQLRKWIISHLSDRCIIKKTRYVYNKNNWSFFISKLNHKQNKPDINKKNKHIIKLQINAFWKFDSLLLVVVVAITVIKIREVKLFTFIFDSNISSPLNRTVHNFRINFRIRLTRVSRLSEVLVLSASTIH